MPQSLAAVYIHIVFSTDDRRPFLKDPTLRAELHSYLGGASNALGCASLVVGGVEDHVHVLARQSRTISLSDWVRKVKTSSSQWLKRQDASLSTFAWQSGYGAFSVGSKGVELVRGYIQNQEEHHRHFSFQDEFLQLLKEHGLEWDERYLWD